VILGLAVSMAMAEPPRGEFLVGWAGNTTEGYGYLTAMPSLSRSSDASLVLRGGTSHLYYEYYVGDEKIDVVSPGASLGLGLRYAPGTISLDLSTSFEARSTTRMFEDEEAVQTYDLGASVSGNAYWMPVRRMAVFGTATFSGPSAYLWARIGGLHQLVPRLKRGTPYSLWFGLDGTARGNKDAHATEAGAVLELRSRDLHGSISVRGGVTAENIGDRDRVQPTVGIGAYWSY